MILYRRKYLLPFLIVFGTILFAGFSDSVQNHPDTDFWAMKGTLSTHIFLDESDTLSGPEIFELKDEKGLTIWFGRHIFKDVCISGECKMIRLWLFWDGAANFLGFQVPEGEPLTKSDHTPFEPEDYTKLEAILQDTTSILKNLRQEELIVVPDSIDPYEAFEVDGYTAATQPALAEVVVKDAVYSCHTLWHTAHGPVQHEILKLLNKRLNPEFLSSMFDSGKIPHTVWAIKSVTKHPEYHAEFYPKILAYIGSANTPVSQQALNYFEPGMLTDTGLQHQLAATMETADMSVKYEILWKFVAHGNTDEPVLRLLLQQFINQNIGVGAYNLILRLVKPEHLGADSEIIPLLRSLAGHQNGYVRNLTRKTLDMNTKTTNTNHAPE